MTNQIFVYYSELPQKGTEYTISFYLIIMILVMLTIAFVAILRERFISFFSAPHFTLPVIHKQHHLIVNFDCFIDKIQKVLYPDDE